MTTIDYVIQITGYLIDATQAAENIKYIQNKMNLALGGKIIDLANRFELPLKNIIVLGLYIRSNNYLLDIHSTLLLVDRTNNTKITIDIENDTIIYRYKIDNETINHLEVTFEEYEELKIDPMIFSLSVFNFDKQIIKDCMNHCPRVLEILSTIKYIV